MVRKSRREEVIGKWDVPLIYNCLGKTLKISCFDDVHMTDLTSLLKEPKQLAREGKFDEAIESYTKDIGRMTSNAVTLHGDASPERSGMLAALLNGRGVMHRMKRDYVLASNDYLCALDISESVHHAEQSALSWVNIADLNRVWEGDFAKAHSNLDEGLALAPYGSLVDAQARDQRGLVFAGQKLFDCALAAYDDARRVAEELFEKEPEDEDVQNRLGQILHHIGAAYVYASDSAKFEDAYRSQQKALRIFETLHDAAGIANTVSTMGHLALAAGRYEEVIKIGERAWDLVTAMKYERGVRTVALNLAEAHLQQGRMEEAQPYLAALEENIGQLGDNDAVLMDPQFQRVVRLLEGGAAPDGRLAALIMRFS